MSNHRRGSDCDNDQDCQDRLSTPQYSNILATYPWVTAEDCFCDSDLCHFIPGCPDGYEGVVDNTGKYCNPIPGYNIPAIQGTVPIRLAVSPGGTIVDQNRVPTVVDRAVVMITKLISDTTDPNYLEPIPGSMQDIEITAAQANVDGWVVSWNTEVIPGGYTTNGIFEIKTVVYDDRN